MSEETSSTVLETVLKDISASQKLIDDSVVTLSKALKSVNFKCVDDETDIVDKTRSIVDAINKNISDCHSNFYKFYDVWKNKQSKLFKLITMRFKVLIFMFSLVAATILACYNGRRTSNGSNESLLLESPDLIDSSLNFVEGNGNGDTIDGNNVGLCDKETELRTGDDQDKNKENDAICDTSKSTELNTNEDEPQQAINEEVGDRSHDNEADDEINKKVENPQKSDGDTIKVENPIKIKCVDINKLLEVYPESSKTKTPTISNANASVVKIVVLNDSDSDDCQRGRSTRNKVELRKRTLRSESLRNPVAEKVNSLRKKEIRKGLRKRPVMDITNVSSLSENSTTDSDSEEEIAKSKKRGKSKLKRGITNDELLRSFKDKKFQQKAYIPLSRIPPDKLKENYEKTVVKREVQKLTKMDSLKRSRRQDTKSSDSAESETSNTKKRHCSKNANTSENVVASGDSDASMQSDPLKINDDDIAEHLGGGSEDANPKRCEEELAEVLLNRIEDGENRAKSSSDSDDKKSDGGDTSKKKEKKDKAKKTVEREISNSDKEGNSASDIEAKKRKKQWRKDKLLTEDITESDSEENFSKFMKKREILKEKNSDTEDAIQGKQKKRLKKKRGKYVLRSSGSESASSSKSKSRDNSPGSSSGSNSGSGKNDAAEKEKKKQNRRRIKKIKDSSDEAEDDDKSTRKNIRKVWSRNTLSESTIAAEKEEKERKARIAEKQKKYNLIFENDALEKANVDKVVLDFDDKTKKELLKIDSRLVKNLKPHQAKGIQFMWDTCFESLERAKSTKGSGCILAHCMGLGKTLQVIALVHTLLTKEEKSGVRKVLIVCPLNTVLNWVAEFKKWLPNEDDLEVFELVSFKQNNERMYQVKEWERLGGALILGYDMFRNLTNPANKRLTKRMRETFHTCLVDPGPQLVVCDEGHLLKNEKTSTSIAMNRLQCMRRVVLTGTPLQNNLKEYFCMVQFVKPNLLGNYKEYLNRFVNPITNGQYTDSTPHDINIMRKRSHVLHKLLDGVVQRRDYSVLAPFLPPKHEYVLFVSLTELQIKLYRHYMREKSGQQNNSGKGKSFLFVDFNEFQRICTHPRVLLDKSNQVKKTRDKNDYLDDESEGSLKDFINDDSEKSTSSPASSTSNDSDSGSDGSHKKKSAKPAGRRRITRATAAIYEISDNEKSDAEPDPPDPSEWWKEFCTDEDLDNINTSGKLSLLFEILKHCESIGDKVLIFSQSLYSLNVIEYFLNKIDDATQTSETNSFCGFSGSWALGLDYFRLDGSSSCDNRAAWCKTFNDPNNIRARLFLISTRAGSLGINLVAANRVIIFDVSWNPSYDTQSIYRVYRFGQTKPSYIYRFVTLGTMEMKIYERQVTKQAISKRVIDEQQIDRHYNQSDLAELYKFDPVPDEERSIPLVPKDVLLGELLQADKKIYSYHEHQSLLENKVDEVLDEEERKAAWEEFENEKKAKTYSGTIAGYSVANLIIGLQTIIRRENPTWNNTLVSQATTERFKLIEEEIAAGGKNAPVINRN
ncbi:rad54-like [Holotrichia oblita]|uniref:Rad54-like n=1 Tax=Holotrichia oblita TaxID=644536 RepID=A0ACB9TQD9_HOLOL|nr:rad54-like [Holotrichia oblita]